MSYSLQALMDKQQGICHYCDCSMTTYRGHGNSVTRDHLIPKKRGGFGLHDNKVGACKRCNELKGVMSEKEFRLEYPTPDAIERAYPMALAERRSQQGWARGHERGHSMQATVDALAKPKSFVGTLSALDKDGKEVAIFHPKEK